MLKIKLFLFGLIFLASGSTVFSQMEDWKQYISSMAGFNVEYPSDWRIEEEAYEQVWHVRFKSPEVFDRDVNLYSSIRICSKPKKASFEILDGCAQHHLYPTDRKVISEKKFKLDRIKIHKVESENKYAPSISYFHAFFSTKDRDFQVTGYFLRRFNLDSYIPVFDQMLTTFQPLKEKSVLTYRNDKYDFFITFPTSWKSCPIVKTDESEEKILVLVPEGKLCLGENYISVARLDKLSGRQLVGLQLREILEKNSFNKFSPFLENISASQGEKKNEQFIYREGLFFTNFTFTCDLLKITAKFELNQNIYQEEAREIFATIQRFIRNKKSFLNNDTSN